MTQVTKEIGQQALTNNIPEYNRLVKYGESLIGKKAQSRILKELGDNGKSYFAPAKEITGFEIVEMFMQPELMVTIDGESVFESTLFNIQ